MKYEPQLSVRAAARSYTPLIAFFAILLLSAHPAGSGVGLFAGFAFALLIALHILTYGVSAARAAAPPWLMRPLLALGLLAALFGVGAPLFPYAARIAEAGLFVSTAIAAPCSMEARRTASPIVLRAVASPWLSFSVS